MSKKKFVNPTKVITGTATRWSYGAMPMYGIPRQSTAVHRSTASALSFRSPIR